MRLTVLLGRYPPDEAARRQEVVARCAAPATEVEFVELAASFYGEHAGVVAAAIAAPLVCEAAVQAQARGSDALLVFGSLDPGIEAASHLVDMPVIGVGRVGYNVAAMLGHRIASLVYTDSSIPYARGLVRRYGLENRVVSIRSLGVSLAGLAEAARSGELLERLVEIGQTVVEVDGAEVLFPQGVSLVPVHCEAETLSRKIGIPVVDGLAAGVRLAEFFVDTGVTNSRAAYPAIPWPAGGVP